MFAQRITFSTALLAMLVASLPALAQRPPTIPVQEDLFDKSFRIRGVNGLSIPVYYKLVGGRGKGYAYETLRPGESERDHATSGEKVLCVWDLNGDVIMACVVRVDRHGSVVIRGPGSNEPGERPKAFAPRMRITPE